MRFERSNGLDTALYKNIPLPLHFYLPALIPLLFLSHNHSYFRPVIMASFFLVHQSSALCLQVMMVKYCTTQWRINNGAIGARAPGPRDPGGPQIINKQKL